MKYENFENMYECVYNQMVVAGVARQLPEKVYRDRDGVIIANEEEALVWLQLMNFFIQIW